MPSAWEERVGRWVEAGLLEAATADRIRVWEAAHAPPAVRWPVRLALGLGGLLLCAGVLLFVAAHWDALGPGSRYALLLGTVAAFHLAAALVAERSPTLATTLHACGTVALGGGIFLSGQIFHLSEHWPGGFLLWAIGAWIGWVAFFIPEHVRDPSVRPPGEELWVELTLPAHSWPRPIRLGVMRRGELTPLELR